LYAPSVRAQCETVLRGCYDFRVEAGTGRWSTRFRWTGPGAGARPPQPDGVPVFALDAAHNLFTVALFTVADNDTMRVIELTSMTDSPVRWPSPRHRHGHGII
jgi:hypothetical protein